MTQVLGLLPLPEETLDRIVTMPDGTNLSGMSEHALRRIVRAGSPQDRIDAVEAIFRQSYHEANVPQTAAIKPGRAL